MPSMEYEAKRVGECKRDRERNENHADPDCNNDTVLMVDNGPTQAAVLSLLSHATRAVGGWSCVMVVSYQTRFETPREPFQHGYMLPRGVKTGATFFPEE